MADKQSWVPKLEQNQGLVNRLSGPDINVRSTKAIRHKQVVLSEALHCLRPRWIIVYGIQVSGIRGLHAGVVGRCSESKIQLLPMTRGEDRPLTPDRQSQRNTDPPVLESKVLF